MALRVSESKGVFFREGQEGYSVWQEFNISLEQLNFKFLMKNDGQALTILQIYPLPFSQTTPPFPPAYLDLMHLSIKSITNTSFWLWKPLDALKEKNLFHRILKTSEHKALP